MEKNYTTSKETARYLDAVVRLHEGESLALEACEEIYGNLNEEAVGRIIEPFQKKLQEAVDELFKLVQANIEVNLGFLDNLRKETVAI